MKIIRPFKVSDLSFVSSDVAAADPIALGAWASGTTYAIGNTVQVDSPTFTFTASGSILTATAHGWANGDVLKVSSSGTLPGGLTANTLYYIVESTTDTFKLSVKKNGAPVTTTSAGTGTHTATVSSHRLYESLVNSNVGNTPHKSPAQWLDIGATNRWRPFDQEVNSQVEQIDTLTYKIQVNGRIDSLALLNVSAAEAVVTARESGGGAVVYGPITYNLISTNAVTSYWAWFFEEILRRDTFVDVDFPPYLDLEIEVTLNDLGNTVKLGGLVVGLSKIIGTTNYGANVGIADYSVKQRDDFGNFTVLERAFSKKGTFNIVVDRLSVDGVKQVLEQYRATPVVYVGTDSYDSTVIYGFYRDFNVSIAYPSYSLCTIDVEGLT